MAAQMECFVTGALATMLRLLRLVGLAPLCFTQHAGGWRVVYSPTLAKLGRVATCASRTEKEILMWCLMDIYYYILQLFFMQYSLTILYVGSTFTALNHYLRNLIRDNRIISECDAACIHRASDAFAASCRLVKKVNTHNGVKVLIFLGLLFLLLTTSLFNFIDSITTTWIFSSPPLATMAQNMFEVKQFFHCIVYMFDLIIIIEPCHQTHKEASTIRDLVSQLLCLQKSASEKVIDELDQLQKCIILKDVTYTAANVIKISRRLFILIFTGITTYLVIMIDIK